MARVDWSSAEVVIEIDDAHTEQAAQRIQMQVDIAIEAAPLSTPPNRSTAGNKSQSRIITPGLGIP
jgi:hypothetical protein